MGPIVFLLVLSGSCLLKSHDIIDNQYGTLERWGASRIKRDAKEDVQKLSQKFPKGGSVSCDTLYQTDEFPFVAIVLYKDDGRLLCMGAIIDERHILTAKRCYEKAEKGDLLVLVGYYSPYWGQFAQVLRVHKILNHETDLTLLRLKSSMSFSDYVKPARIPPMGTGTWKFKDVYGKTGFHVIGFMVDRYDLPGDYVSRKLMYTIKEDALVEAGACATNLSKLVINEKKTFCTFGNATFCWGALGGPVLKRMSLEHDPYWLLIGTVVVNNCTADTIGPNVVSRTDSYGEWIRGNTFHDRHPF